MKVSIIVPVYNSTEVIDRLFVTLKDYKNSSYEIIIIDDCSSDNSFKKIKEIIKKGKYKNIRLLKNDQNKGPSYTRNRGIMESTGLYIAFLDSDDGWHKDKLALQIQLMKEKNVMISGTIHQVIDEKSFLKLRTNSIKLHDLNYKIIKWPGILFKSPFSTPSVVTHKNLKKYLFDEDMKYAEDYNLWKKITHDFPALKIDYPLTYTFKHDFLSSNGSLSSNLKMMQRGVNVSFIKMIKNGDYFFFDRILLIMGLLFSQIKYIRRMFLEWWIKTK